jgi:hypothetical protein
MRLRSKLALLAASVLSLSLATGAPEAALASSHPAAHHRAPAPTYVVLTGGATTLALDPGTAQVLTDNNIAVAPVGAARVTSGGIAFPVQGGLLNARTLAGKVTHSGGLTFSAGGKDLTIRDFTVNTRTKTLSAWVDQVGTRITVLDLKLGKIKVTVTKRHVTIANVKAVLDQGAADALNAYYGVSLFSGGLKIGTATISASSKVLHG